MKTLQNIIDEHGFDRMLSRLAHEILERNLGLDNLAIIGLRTRGEFVAQRLASKLEKIEGTLPELGVLDVTLYRDDVRQHLRTPEVRATDIAFDITDKNVVLVDDVLFTGRTVRSALNALVDLGRARTIQLVALVDRGHREVPIRADFIGKNIPTSRGQEVRVHLKEVDGHDGIDLVSIED
ncbi:MAG: bifunctional pyr operon transcriptional regulator/uracil phosphoribosyltransferase PyrR [Ignavibacteria bacterium]|nr:MAG: bifunctional pyr operon transcriptional regulator/uracil phosphoribosyltransferase PyrR [Ignavibacteria bacterium]